MIPYPHHLLLMHHWLIAAMLLFAFGHTAFSIGAVGMFVFMAVIRALKLRQLQMEHQRNMAEMAVVLGKIAEKMDKGGVVVMHDERPEDKTP